MTKEEAKTICDKDIEKYQDMVAIFDSVGTEKIKEYIDFLTVCRDALEKQITDREG